MSHVSQTECMMDERPQELDELMNLYASPLFRYAARLVRDDHAARDVVQEVFIRYSRLAPEKLPGPGSERSWLYRVTHNRAVDWIRADRRRKSLHETHAELQAVNREASKDDRMEVVLARVHLLKEKERAVLLLRLQEGLSYKEISEVTELSTGNVGYLLHQAVRTLSETFRKEEER